MRRLLPALLAGLALALFLSVPALAKEKTETHQGWVIKVNGNQLHMLHPNGKEAIHILAPNASVLCDGKACKLSDLKPGTRIWVTTPANNLKTALRVESKDGNPPQVIPPQVNPPQVSPPQAPRVNPPQVIPPQVNPPRVNPPQVNPPRVNPPQVNPPRVNPPQARLLQAKPPQRAARPYLGVLAESAEGGVAIREMEPNGPAAKAGLKNGDLIQKVGKRPTPDFEALVNALANHKPGDKVDFHFKRGNKEQDATVTLGERPAPGAAEARPQRATGFLGIATRDLTQDARNRLAIPPQQGALVVEVMPGTPAAKAGLQNGDVIMSVNNKPINGPAELRNAIQQAGAGQEVSLKVQRGQKTENFKAQLEESPVEFILPQGR